MTTFSINSYTNKTYFKRETEMKNQCSGNLINNKCTVIKKNTVKIVKTHRHTNTQAHIKNIKDCEKTKQL